MPDIEVYGKPVMVWESDEDGVSIRYYRGLCSFYVKTTDRGDGWWEMYAAAAFGPERLSMPSGPVRSAAAEQVDAFAAQADFWLFGHKHQ